MSLTKDSPSCTREAPASGRSARFTAPSPGSPFAIAIADSIEAARLVNVWGYSGWVDVVWRYRRTKIGPLWHTLSLGAFVVVMGTIWSVVLDQDPETHFRFVGTSLIAWSLLSYFVTEGTHSMLGGAPTALAIRYPFIAFTFLHVWKAVLLFGHHFVLYLLIVVGTQFNPGLTALYAIPGFLLLVANGVGISLLVGMVSLRWRDFIPAAASAMQIMMFVTPVLWPKDLLGPELAYAVDYNPLYHLVRIVRDPLLGQLPPAESWIWACGTLVVGLILSFWAYGRCRDRIAFWY